MAASSGNDRYGSFHAREPLSFKYLDHTADLGIEVSAPSLEALFSECALALSDTLSDVVLLRAGETRRLQVEAPDRELLAVEWLQELLFLFDTEGWLACKAEVKLEYPQTGGIVLRSVVEGERFDPERHPVRTLLKAVTYHDLRVWREGDSWQARIIFDV